MNENKICFISCVNDVPMYQESIRYIKALELPSNLEMEFISITDAVSMTEGYNRAMKQSNAKFKVYLHQDVFIIHKSFIVDLITLFLKYPNLGMVGMVGAGYIPPNGVWWESEKLYGTVIENSATGRMRKLSFGEGQKEMTMVSAVDGLLMATQNDIGWREDLFDGWHFYDLSQSMEFINAGYEVGIPKQMSAWCIHDCGIVSVKDYDKYNRLFLDTYVKDIADANFGGRKIEYT